jgi:hypothetical protein
MNSGSFPDGSVEYTGITFITPNYEGRDALTKMISAHQRRILFGIDPSSGPDRSVLHDGHGNICNEE